MHKNHKFTNKNTHKLNMQAERDIPCERETESETETENEADREIERENESICEIERENESICEIERQNESICVEIALDWEGDSEIERFGLWVCFALGNRWYKLWEHMV